MSPTLDRMSPLDAEFFCAEHRNVPLHIGSVAVFDGATRAEGSTTRKAVSGSGLSVTARPVSSRLRTTAFPRAY